jgi:hypothetical protein
MLSDKNKEFLNKYYGSGNEIPIFFYSSFKEKQQKQTNKTIEKQQSLTYSY